MVRVSDPTAGELVAIPKFYYRWTKNGTSMKLQISMEQVEGFLTSPAHADRGDGKGERSVVYVGRYHCADDYKSSGGAIPKNSITRSAARTGISALGTGIYQSDFALRWTIQMLYLVEFADWNSQNCIGYGCSPGGAKWNMGYTDSMGYHTGTTAASRTTYGGTQYRNIEGLWDNVYDWMDGCYYSTDGLSVIMNPDQYSDTENGTLVGLPTGRYTSAFSIPTQAGLEWALYPSAASGSGSTYVTDDWGFGGSYPCLYVGGSYGQGLSRGLFCVYCDSVSSAGSGIGCRLQKLP